MGKINVQGDLDIHNYLNATNTNLYLSSASSDYSIRFRIGATEVARLSPSGCLNIGTTQTSTAYKLYVNGASFLNGSTILRNTVLVNNTALGGTISFQATRSTDDKATGLINYYALGSSSATDYNLGAFYFTQYSYTDGTYNRIEYYDRYHLPVVAAGKTTNNDYQILTTKSTITVAQGGTGVTSKAKIAAGLLYNVTETNPTSATRYSIPFLNTGNAVATATTDYAVRTNLDFNLLLLQGTTSALGYSVLELGNGTASDTAGNKYGMVRLYSNSTGYANLRAATTTSNTTHYLPTTGGTIINSAGGTITGALVFSTANQYYSLSDHTGGSIRLNNGDIGGVNSIYFKDAAGAGEGLHFYVSSTTVDTLRASSGVLYFDKTYDITTSTAAATYTVLHSGNFTSYLNNTYVNTAGDTMTGNLIINANLTIGTLGSNTYRQFTICRGTNNGTMWMAGISGGTGGTIGVSTDDGTQNQIQITHTYTQFDKVIYTPRLVATSSVDAQATSERLVALITGPSTGQHLEFDGNEIISKSNATTGGILYLNSGGTYSQLYKVVLSTDSYGSTLPTAVATGQIFFKT